MPARRGENHDVGVVKNLTAKGVAGANRRADPIGDGQHLCQSLEPAAVVVHDGEPLDLLARGKLTGGPAADRTDPQQDGAHYRKSGPESSRHPPR